MTVAIQRVRVRVEGVVQGVGFRPYVHRLAAELGLDGFVRNDSRGAVIEAEGTPEAIEALLARLPAEAPPAAEIERVSREVVPPRGEKGFGIVQSTRSGLPTARGRATISGGASRDRSSTSRGADHSSTTWRPS